MKDEMKEIMTMLTHDEKLQKIQDILGVEGFVILWRKPDRTGCFTHNLSAIEELGLLAQEQIKIGRWVELHSKGLGEEEER